MNTLRLTTLVCALALSLPAHAERVKAPAGASKKEQDAVRIFNLLDTDGDGLISRKEAQQAFLLRPSLVRDFEGTDTNKDGYLSEAEVRAQAERRRAERRARRAREQAQKEAQAKQAQASAAAQNKHSN
ncbi:MAG: EF-hand domain-containing protein [Ottowia sp.]|nr:EF-hand domain-containing protein [Ottowia sp.]